MIKPISVQLYSLRTEAAKDFLGVLKRVADIGYKGVEPAGFWGIRPSEFRKILNDLGLEMYSSHSPWCTDVNSMGEKMDMADALGLNKLVCGYAPDDFKDLDSIKRTAEKTNAMNEVATRNGYTLFQHNHAFEFERLDGKLKYEIYAEMCPVKFQLDAYWSTNFGNEDAVANLKKFADRTILLHIKDGILVQKQNEQSMVNGILDRKIDLVPLGTGELDIKGVIANAPEQVETVVVELDYCNIDMFEAIEKSYKYMTENKLALGNK